MKKLKVGLFLALVILAGCTSHKKDLSKDLNEEPITQDLAKEYVLYAMMSSNSYHEPKKRGIFPIEDLGWYQIDVDGNATAMPSYKNQIGVSFDIWKSKSSNEIIVAFRGSNNWMDWVFGNFSIAISPHYKSAKKQFKKHVYDKYCPKNICSTKVIVTGHSLGGGLALSTSLKFGVDAIAFDGSPRVFDGRHNIQKHATRIGIYQKGEILQKIRKKYRKYNEVMEGRPVYVASYAFGETGLHAGHKLAECILDHATKSDPKLKPILNEYRKSIKESGC